jgi:hypothetical protein
LPNVCWPASTKRIAEAERRADAHDRGEIGAISIEDAMTRLRADIPGQAAG